MTAASPILMVRNLRRSGQSANRPAWGSVQAYLELLLGTTAVMLATDSALLLSAWADARLGLAACLGLLGVSQRRWRRRLQAKIWIAGGAALLAWTSLAMPGPLLRVTGLAWLFGGLHLAVERTGARGATEGVCPEWPPRFLVLHLASVSYGIAIAAYERSDCAWSLVRYMSGHLAGAGSPAGAWVAGLPIYVFGFLILIWQAVLRPGRAYRTVRLLAHAGLLAACLVASRMAWDRFDLVGSVGVSILHAAALGWVTVVAATAGGSSQNKRGLLPEHARSGEPGPQGVGRHGSWGLRQAGAPPLKGLRPALLAVSPRAASCLAVLATLTVAGAGRGGLAGISGSTGADGLDTAGAGPSEKRSTENGAAGAHSTEPGAQLSACTPRPTSFAIYSSGMLDWEVPDSTRIGLLNSGMFGLFRQSLERYAGKTGGTVATFDSEADSAGLRFLDGTSVVVFINPTAAPSQQAVRAIGDFVRSGGGLLVLGDHTDILGSRGPLNQVLSFTHIGFNFDSAVPLRQHWRGCLEVRWRALGGAMAEAIPRAPGDPNLHLQLAVGASLDVKRPARPVIVGRYGFADAGDPRNGGSQAFIGNLKHDRGEQLGDVVLAAAEEVGRGRVLVLGDTSPFQNGALFLSQDFVSSAIGWLVGSAGGAVAATDLAWSDLEAVIDFSTHPQANAALFDETSLGGLANCLARDGITPRPAFSRADWTPQAALIVLTAPTCMRTAHVDWLLDYMAHGGKVILAQGYAEPQPCHALLQQMGLEITDIPLGGGQGGGGGDAGSGLAHRDAYAIRVVNTDGRRASVLAARANDHPWRRVGIGPDARREAGACRLLGDATVLAHTLGHPTAVARRYGRGSLVLVSDGRFFLDANLEGERSANRRNIRFVHRLLDLLGVNAGLAEADVSNPDAK